MPVEKITNLPSIAEIQNEIENEEKQNKTPPKKRKSLKSALYVLCGIAFVLVMITFLTGNGTGLSTGGKGSITGNVVNELGTPLPAEIYVASTDLKVTANSDGNFSLENIPAGDREVFATYGGQGVDLYITVNANQRLSLGVIQIRSTQIPAK